LIPQYSLATFCVGADRQNANTKTALKIAIGSKRTKDNLGPVFGQDVVYDILVLGSKNWSNILFPSEVIWRHGVLNPCPP
jgi:hypothetical protein